jgi:hypothetical protein
MVTAQYIQKLEVRIVLLEDEGSEEGPGEKLNMDMLNMDFGFLVRCTEMRRGKGGERTYSDEHSREESES